MLFRVLAIAIAVAALAGSAGAHPLPHRSGLGLADRIEFLEGAVAHDRYVCRRGSPRLASTRWHCAALVWTSRELRAAESSWQRAWWLWLPAKWARVGGCETNRRVPPGNWSHSNSDFVSAFGIRRGSALGQYDDDARSAGMPPWSDDPRLRPTPWEQFQTALDHYRRFGGFSGWGCGGA